MAEIRVPVEHILKERTHYIGGRGKKIKQFAAAANFKSKSLSLKIFFLHILYIVLYIYILKKFIFLFFIIYSVLLFLEPGFSF